MHLSDGVGTLYIISEIFMAHYCVLAKVVQIYCKRFSQSCCCVNERICTKCTTTFRVQSFKDADMFTHIRFIISETSLTYSMEEFAQTQLMVFKYMYYTA